MLRERSPHHFLLGPNITPPLLYLYPEDDYLSFMLRLASNLPLRSTLRRRRVLESACSDRIMRRCSNYVRCYKDCKVGSLSDSCTEYARNSLSYELAFLEAKLRRIRRKRRKKLEAVYTAASQIQELVAY